VDIDILSASQSAISAKTDDSDTDSIRQAVFELLNDHREPLVLHEGAVLTRLRQARKQLKANIDQDAVQKRINHKERQQESR